MDTQDFFQLQEPFFPKDAPLWFPLLHMTPLCRQKEFRIEVNLPQGVYLENKDSIYIGKNSKVEPGAYIKGPCYIGNHCEIRANAYIRGPVYLSDYCVVGHCTEVKNSLFLPGAKAAHFAYVGDSILGQRVNLGAGVKCANLRLDEKEIFIFKEGKKLSTGLKKFGAILGDDVKVGCNTVLSPGTLLGKGSVCYPCLNLSGFYPGGSQIKTQETHART